MYAFQFYAIFTVYSFFTETYIIKRFNIPCRVLSLIVFHILCKQCDHIFCIIINHFGTIIFLLTISAIQILAARMSVIFCSRFCYQSAFS